MKALVTGGAGFIGSHVVDALVKKGIEVVVIDDLSTGRRNNLNKNAKFIKFDISDPKTSKLVKKEKPEIIFHLAAQALVTVSVRQPTRDVAVNVVGLLNLLDGAVASNTKKFVFSSTGGAIYGDVDNIPTPETTAANPVSPYGIAKLSGEHYLSFYKNIYGLNTTILRYSNVYGPRQNPFGEGGAVAIFTQKLLSSQRPTIFGDGTMTRDYIYVGDVVNANLKAAKLNKYGPYNIGTAKETSTEDLFRLIQKILKSKLEPNFVPERLGEVRRSCLSYKLAEKELNWKPLNNLYNGLDKTAQSFLKEK